MHKLLLAIALAGLASAQTSREDLERMALSASPSLRQSAAEVRAAAGRVRQAGLYPNPMLGFTGDHNTPALDGGSLGGFAEQRIVTGGKLGLDRKAADQDRLGAEEMAKAERLRVIAAIDALYYRGLGEQRLLDVRIRMAQLTQTTAATWRELANLGQADQPDVFEVEIEAQRAQLAVTMARNALDRTWREIQALVNQPGLKPSTLAGDLEAIGKLDPDSALLRILTDSPRGADRPRLRRAAVRHRHPPRKGQRDSRYRCSRWRSLQPGTPSGPDRRSASAGWSGGIFRRRRLHSDLRSQSGCDSSCGSRTGSSSRGCGARAANDPGPVCSRVQRIRRRDGGDRPLSGQSSSQGPAGV